MSEHLICINCFKDIELSEENTKICPFCKFDNSEIEVNNSLPQRTLLLNRYIIGKIISSNAESFTYLAFDKETEKIVEIQEFFADCCMFRKENKISVASKDKSLFQSLHTRFAVWSKSLQIFSENDAVVEVINSFSENNTSYVVYTHYESVSLSDFVKNREVLLSYEEVKKIFLPLIETLEKLHNFGLEHLAINPDNIIVCENDFLRIKNFASEDIRRVGGYYEPELIKGYSAYEQYVDDIICGPRTDVYAVACVMIFALSGERPSSVLRRLQNPKLMISKEILENITESATYALSNALQLMPEDRTTRLEIFKDELYDEKLKKPQTVKKTFVKEVPEYRGDGIQKVIQPFLWMILAFVCTFYFAINVGLDMVDTGDISIDDSLNEAIEAFTPESVSVVKVPDMVGDIYTDWIIMMQDELIYNFTLDVISEFSEEVTEGYIIRTDPVADDYVIMDGSVTVYLSIGTQVRTLPKITKLTFAEAEAALKEVGMIVYIEEVEGSSYSIGTVIGYGDELEAGDEMDYGSKITVLVSAG
ncbi:MAG: PASTA domain-containing protein [Clostridia bacterium]